MTHFHVLIAQSDHICDLCRLHNKARQAFEDKLDAEMIEGVTALTAPATPTPVSPEIEIPFKLKLRQGAPTPAPPPRRRPSTPLPPTPSPSESPSKMTSAAGTTPFFPHEESPESVYRRLCLTPRVTVDHSRQLPDVPVQVKNRVEQVHHEIKDNARTALENVTNLTNTSSPPTKKRRPRPTVPTPTSTPVARRTRRTAEPPAARQLRSAN